VVNTEPGRASAADGLPDVTALEKFLDEHRIVPRPAAGPADLDAVRNLRPRLFAVWEKPGQPSPLASIVNDLLEESDARPWLTDHDGGWHLHVSKPDSPVLHRVTAQIAFAFADLVRLGETERLRRCLAPGCQSVLVDLSRNRSRLYCDTGNCGNRQHAAAYRARQVALRVSRDRD
jgi:predicted RNA-binding Zn ribbon-like protein